MSTHQERRPPFSGTRGAYWQLYCSLCGCPLHMRSGGQLTWLEDILVLPVETEQFIAIPVDFVDGLDRTPGDAYEAWANIRQKPAFPIHKACLTLADAAVKTTSGPPFSDGGPPKSMLDVLNVLRARLIDFDNRSIESYGAFMLPEPSDYGGLESNMGREGWESKSVDDDDWLKDPTTVTFQVLPAQHRKTSATFKLPFEILQYIFEYMLGNQDASSVPAYFFPASLWRNHLKTMPVLKGLPLPDDDCVDWEELGRNVSKVSQGQAVPGFGALRNRFRIWKLIANMQFNDNYDIRRGCCKCAWSADGHCAVWYQAGDEWCSGSWDKWQERDPSSPLIPTLRELSPGPPLLDDRGGVSEDLFGDIGCPIPDYIVNSKINASFRAWLNTVLDKQQQ